MFSNFRATFGCIVKQLLLDLLVQSIHPYQAQPGGVTLLFAAMVPSFIISPFPSAYGSSEVNHLVHRGPIVAGSEKQSNFGNTCFSILCPRRQCIDPKSNKVSKQTDSTQPISFHCKRNMAAAIKSTWSTYPIILSGLIHYTHYHEIFGMCTN